MIDYRTLTDEELAEWERQVHAENAAYVTVHLAPKLIDALRASRGEVKRLTADRDSWARMYFIAKARADAAEAKLSGHYRVDL